MKQILLFIIHGTLTCYLGAIVHTIIYSYLIEKNVSDKVLDLYYIFYIISSGLAILYYLFSLFLKIFIY